MELIEDKIDSHEFNELHKFSTIRKKALTGIRQKSESLILTALCKFAWKIKKLGFGARMD